MSSRWPTCAVLLLAAHVALLLFVHARPGAMAIVPFVVGPIVLACLTAATIVLAGYDVLYGGWRRLLRGRIVFDALALAASIFIVLFAYRTYPSSHDATMVGPCLTLPLQGDVAVLQGGRTVDVNDHAGSPARRYAYDLALLRDGATHRGEGDALDDYYGYGEPVLAPMAGLVVSVVDGEADRPPGAFAWRPGDGAYGNHVVVQIDDEQFLFIAHLQAGSIRVRPGDSIRVDAPIGQVGNSGRSSTPHVHLHVQDSPVANRGEGIPVEVCAYDVVARGASWDSARRVDRGMPTGRVRPQVVRRSQPIHP